VIRQAISCDICGTEKKQTNHWFVAYDQGGELRVSGWNSRNRLRPGTRHLCGQTCLHKLVDDFMARALTARVPQTTQDEEEVMEQAVGTDTSLTSGAAYREIESSARLIPTPTRTPAAPKPAAPAALASAPAAPKPAALPRPMELVVVPARPTSEEAVAAADEPPRFASRNWRAAAWERERERERELRAGGHPLGMTARRRYSS
jgi:nucleoid-associated protein YgaU